MTDVLPYGHQCISDEDIQAVVEVLKGDYLTQGPLVDRFEESIRAYTGARYCVAVSNGTAALHIAVAALELDAGQEGITSPNTFLASANCLVYCGLTPRFADIDPRTYNIDPAEVEHRLTPRTRVIIPVHFAGRPAEMGEIAAIAKSSGAVVIEDAAHAIGSTYPDGGHVGNCAHSAMTTFSFHPVKTITTAEGGAVTTNDETLYKRLRALRSHGITRDPAEMDRNPGPWYHEMRSLGFNYRLTDLQAALGAAQMTHIESFRHRRREIVAHYNRAFAATAHVVPPREDQAGSEACFHLYVVRIDFTALGKPRARVMQELRERGVGTQVHYIPVPTQPYYRSRYGYAEGDFPRAEAYYEQALSLPLFPGMGDDDTDRVIDAVKSVTAV